MTFSQEARELRSLGEQAFHQGRFAEAAEFLSRALQLEPERAEALNNLGEALRLSGRSIDAERCYRDALRLNANFAETHNNLGVLLKDLGRLDESERSLRRALELKPGFAMALNNLATVLMRTARLEEAELCLRRALEAAPDFPFALSNLGAVLQDFGAHAEAERCYRRALAIDSMHADAHNNLGTMLQERGRHDEAIASYRRALELNPDNAAAYSNLLLCLNYAPGIAAGEIFAAHREYARRFAPPALAGTEPRFHFRGKPGKLRIGYVSGDLREHPVGRFLEPVLEHHDRKRFEVFCYSNHAAEDAFSERLRSLADGWRRVYALDDDRAAERIREDEVHVLVDLSGHTNGNRLPVFARRPAPVQASWLGYLNTTGLDAMDYRITDLRASPRGMFETYHTERLVRLTGCQWCYQPRADAPDLAPPPSLLRGYATFGAFTSLAKLTHEVIDLWSRLLHRLPGSRLIVAGRGLAAGDEGFLGRFARYGIKADRLDLLPYRSFGDYLAMHGEVDIVLDTFPYTGGTTSCHALWMGVPVISLAGDTASSRGGASLLGAIGLSELVARTPEQYLDLACQLAGSPGKLAKLRKGMRKRLRESPLTNAAGFTRALERVYGSMWRAWCAKR